jgi:sugar phosphate permease
MSAGRRRGTEIHYGWVVVATGTLSVFACLGLGRFALGMLMPSMAAGLGLTRAELGWIGGANFVGYLAAVLVCAPVAARIGSRLLVTAGLVIVGASMVLVSRASAFAPIAALYAVTGFGSGAANVPVQALVGRWFHGSLRGRAAGFVAMGSGLGIIVSGKLVPAINRARGASGWRTSWLVLGLAVLAVSAIALALLRNRPEEISVQPLGTAPASHPRRGPLAAPPVTRNRAVWLLGLVYALFGYTYAIYVTFIVTVLVRERGFSESIAGRFWSWVGVLSLFSGPLFGALSDRLGRRPALVLVFALQLVAYAIVAAELPRGFLYASIAAFGVAAWSIPSIMVAAVSDHVGGERALEAFGFVTFFFAVGQIAGPSVAGVLAEGTGRFSSSFTMAAALAALAVALSAILPRPRPGSAAAEAQGAPERSPSAAR